MFRWDMHRGPILPLLQSNFEAVDVGISAYVNELKALGLWENTTLVQTSDFGRTYSPNGNLGTDHAWGGNYFVLGGSLKGGNILGDFPSHCADRRQCTLHIGNRMVPSTPWESVWNAVAEWLGVDDGDELNEVLPHRQNFDSSALFSGADMFDTAQ